MTVLLRLHRELEAAGIPVVSVSKTEIQYHSSATPDQITQGNNILANFNFTTAAVAVDTARTQAALDKQQLLNKISDILSNVTDSVTACQTDIADCDVDLTAIAKTDNLNTLKTSVTSVCQNVKRLNQRLEKVINTIGLLTKYIRHDLGD